MIFQGIVSSSWREKGEQGDNTITVIEASKPLLKARDIENKRGCIIHVFLRLCHVLLRDKIEWLEVFKIATDLQRSDCFAAEDRFSTMKLRFGLRRDVQWDFEY